MSQFNFNVDTSKFNLKKDSSSNINNQNVTKIKDIAIPDEYNIEVDYESYNNNSNTVANEMLFADEYIETLDKTISQIDNEYYDLIEKHQNFLIHGEEYGLVRMDPSNPCYMTPEEYLNDRIAQIDQNKCLDENYEFDETIWEAEKNKITKEVEAGYKKNFEAQFEKIVGMTYEEYLKKKDELYISSNELKMQRYLAIQQKKELPYLEIMETKEFQEWVKKRGNDKKNASFDSLYLFDLERKYPSGTLTESEKNMYCYLCETKNPFAADNYIRDIQDRLNRNAGKIEADNFLSLITDSDGKINENALSTLTGTGKGVIDGIDNFADGIVNVFATEGMISQNQYAQMYILEAIKDTNWVKGGYNVGNTIGGMTPTIAASILVSAVATPAAGATVAQVLGGASAAGNAKNQALINGHGLVESSVYGLAIGASDYAVTRLLGNIPYLNSDSAHTLSKMLKAGVGESLQTYMNAGASAFILGEPIDMDKLNDEAGKAFINGFLWSAVLTGAQEVYIKVKDKIIKMEVNKVIEEYCEAKTIAFPYGTYDNIEETITSDSMSFNVERIKRLISQNPSYLEFFQNCINNKKTVEFEYSDYYGNKTIITVEPEDINKALTYLMVESRFNAANINEVTINETTFKIENPSSTNKYYTYYESSDIDKYGHGVMYYIDESMVDADYTFLKEQMAVFEYLKNKYPAIYNKTGLINVVITGKLEQRINVYAASYQKEKTIVLYNANEVVNNKFHYGSVLHEMGHLADPQHWISSSQYWPEAVNADNSWIPHKEGSNYSYGQDHFQKRGLLIEDYADSLAYIERNGFEKFNQKYPNRAKIIHDIFLSEVVQPNFSKK